METSAMGDREHSLHWSQQSHLAHAAFGHHSQMQRMSTVAGIESLAPGPKCFFMDSVKGRGNTATTSVNDIASDADHPSFVEEGSEPQVHGAKGKDSPWHRMKWTNSMVRLLIKVVSCIGEEGTPDCAGGFRRKYGFLQKKGKWKAVSKAMLERGCSVSPQQCEDKFNDLNKRYKRLNEILRERTACRVVENPALLDSMAHLSTKMKDDVKKILSSKHLFYKEMCAYHNGRRIPGASELDLPGCSMPISEPLKEIHGSDEEDDEENEDGNDNDEEYANVIKVEDNVERSIEFGKRKKVYEEDGGIWSQSASISFASETARMLLDSSKSPGEHKEWIRMRILQLQEQRVRLQDRSFLLEEHRSKWEIFCNKKNKEFETLQLENKRMELENERTAMQVKQRGLEIGLKLSRGQSHCWQMRGIDVHRI